MAQTIVDEQVDGPHLGRPVERVEDAALLAARAPFADDHPVRAGTLHAAILRSPHPHAEIASIDVTAALRQPGVAAVITGEDVRRLSDPFMIVLREPLNEWGLAVGRVRFVGEAVAVVLAADRYKAEDAAEQVEVAYRPLPAVVDPVRAAAPDAPLVHEAAGRNLVSDRSFRYGDPEAAFAAADHVVDITIRYPRNALTPMENFVVLAEWRRDEALFDVLSNFQGPYTGHPVMARALRVPESGLRLRTPANSGGSFGAKQAVLPYIVLMCVASRIAGRPVKWVEDRLEHLTAATSGPNREIRLEAAVTREGKVTALRYDQLDDYGAYLRSPMPGPLYRMHGAMTGAYDIPHLAIRNRLVMTNKTPAGLVRGFGGPQVYFALERLMHKIAVALGRDPLELIRLNLIPPGRFPCRVAGGAIYDSGDYVAALDRAAADGDLAGLRRRRDEARAAGRLYGIGYAAVVEPSMSNMGYVSTILPAEERRRRGAQDGAVSLATVSVDPLGSVVVSTDTTPQGQGHATVLAQIVADALGLAPADIRVSTEHDTLKDPWSIAAGTYSCRFSPGTAVAAHQAARKVRDKVARIASQSLNVPPDEIEFAGGRVFARGNPDNALRFARVAGSAHWSPGGLPAGMDGAIRETAAWSPPELAAPDDDDHINTSLAYGFVFDFCGVEVDRDTGRVRIDRYVTMHDAGRLLNPLLAEGQVLGAFGQGIGAALLEEFVYGPDGSFHSGTFADYLLPTTCDVPAPEILHMSTPSPFTPLGAKGIGEGNCMSTPVCLANAVADALGVEDLALPLTQVKLAALLHGDEPPPPAQSDHGPAGSARAVATGGGRALTGTGEAFVPAPPDAVWATLLDPQKLAAVIPGCHALDRVGDNAYRAEVSLGAGPVRGRFQAQVALSDMDPPRAARIAGGLDGPLGSSRGSGRVRLESVPGGTRLTYDYTVEITGKVAAVGRRMLEGASRIVVGQFFERLGRQVGGAPPAAAPSLWRRLMRRLGLR
ncbi:MAG: molybdopterin cofactor-binding domain-containing protein [Rhodospirillales bacterium]